MKKIKIKNISYPLGRFIFWFVPYCVLVKKIPKKYTFQKRMSLKGVVNIICCFAILFLISAFIFIKEITKEYTVAKDKEFIGISYVGTLEGGEYEAMLHFGKNYHLPLKHNELIFHLECEKSFCEVWGFDNETIYKLANLWGTKILDVYTIPDWRLKQLKK